MTTDDISVPAGISLKKSLIEYIDTVIAHNTHVKSRSEYIALLVVKERDFSNYDRFIELFGTIFYPLVIFILFLGFTFTTTGMISTLFFFLSAFAGLILVIMFFTSYMRHGKLPKVRHARNNN